MNPTVSRTSFVRVAALGAAGLLATGLLAGCSSDSGTSPSAGSGTPTGTLNVLVSSADASDAAFKQLNSDFQAKYPGVTVKFSAVPNANFTAARSSRLTAGNVDVVLAQPREIPAYAGDQAGGDDNAAADAGLFVDLSDQSFMKNFTPSVIDSLEYKGKSYTVPTGLSYYTGAFYNKKIFEDQGLQVPTTWLEFESVVSKLQSANITPLGIGGKDSWPAGLGMVAAVQGLYPSADAKQQLAEGLYKKQVSLASGTPLEVMQRVKSLYDAAQKNFPGVAYSAIPAAFANGDVAMTIDGTWDQTTIDQAVGGKFDYGYFPVPVSDTAADNALLGGKVELRMAVASNAPNKDAALAYLKFYSQPSEYAKFVKTTGFAPAQPNVASSEFLQSISKYTATFSPAWDTVWTPNSKAGQAAVFPFNYPGIAPLGKFTATQAAQASETAWQAAS